MKHQGRSKAEKAHPGIDLDALALRLRNKMTDEGLSIRGAADQMRCSAATLTRLLKGSAAASVPDTATLVNAASWLDKGLSNFQLGTRPSRSSLADVELHLRALPRITDSDVRIIMGNDQSSTRGAPQGRITARLMTERHPVRGPSVRPAPAPAVEARCRSSLTPGLIMTVCAVIGSLGPLLWESGISSDVMRPIAAPIVGGMVTSTLAVMVLIPILFATLKERALRRGTLTLARDDGLE